MCFAGLSKQAKVKTGKYPNFYIGKLLPACFCVIPIAGGDGVESEPEALI